LRKPPARGRAEQNNSHGKPKELSKQQDILHPILAGATESRHLRNKAGRSGRKSLAPSFPTGEAVSGTKGPQTC
jgi:hypothetical protein